MFSLWNHLAVASKTMFIRYFCVATLRSCVSHPPSPPQAPHHQTHCLYVQLSTSSVWLSALPHTHTTRNRKIFLEQGWNRVRLGIDANLALIPQVESIPWNRCQVSRQPEGNLKSVTVSVNPSGEYFASCLYDDGQDLQQWSRNYFLMLKSSMIVFM